MGSGLLLVVSPDPRLPIVQEQFARTPWLNRWATPLLRRLQALNICAPWRAVMLRHHPYRC